LGLVAEVGVAQERARVVGLPLQLLPAPPEVHDLLQLGVPLRGLSVAPRVRQQRRVRQAALQGVELLAEVLKLSSHCPDCTARTRSARQRGRPAPRCRRRFSAVLTGGAPPPAPRQGRRSAPRGPTSTPTSDPATTALVRPSWRSSWPQAPQRGGRPTAASRRACRSTGRELSGGSCIR